MICWLLCKTVNLVTNTLGWSEGILSVNWRSHMICHVMTLWIFGASKKLCFWQKREEVFNWLNSMKWVELHKGHVQGSRGEVTCRWHVSCPEWSAFTNGWSNNSADSWSQRRCQLVVRLKANKCCQELLCSLSSYINFLNLLNLQGLRGRLQAPGRFQTSSS